MMELVKQRELLRRGIIYSQSAEYQILRERHAQRGLLALLCICLSCVSCVKRDFFFHMKAAEPEIQEEPEQKEQMDVEMLEPEDAEEPSDDKMSESRPRRKRRRPKYEQLWVLRSSAGLVCMV